MSKDGITNFITCPACGFRMKAHNFQDANKKKFQCPQCGYEFKNPDIFNPNPQDFGKRII